MGEYWETMPAVNEETLENILAELPRRHLSMASIGRAIGISREAVRLGLNIAVERGLISGNPYIRSRGVYRVAISWANRGRTFTPETRAKISAANRGRTFTPETRAKMSAAMSAAKVGLLLTPEHRAKLRGRIFSAAHRAALSAAKMGHPVTPENIAKMQAGRAAQRRRAKGAAA
jgi:hypothetical protein